MSDSLTPRREMTAVHGEDLRRSLDEYRSLICRYIRGELDGRAFEAGFFKRNGGDPYDRPDSVFNLMEHFFFAVDSYMADPAWRTKPEHLDDDQLRATARQHLVDLDQALAQEP